MIGGVPDLTACTPHARQRFANVMDILVDKDVPLHVISDHGPESLVGPDVPDLARTASRPSLLAR